MLLIPGETYGKKEIETFSTWFLVTCSAADTPLHLKAFHLNFRMLLTSVSASKTMFYVTHAGSACGTSMSAASSMLKFSPTIVPDAAPT